jgi:hypothetical protein
MLKRESSNCFNEDITDDDAMTHPCSHSRRSTVEISTTSHLPTIASQCAPSPYLSLSTHCNKLLLCRNCRNIYDRFKYEIHAISSHDLLVIDITLKVRLGRKLIHVSNFLQIRLPHKISGHYIKWLYSPRHNGTMLRQQSQDPYKYFVLLSYVHIMQICISITKENNIS